MTKEPKTQAHTEGQWSRKPRKNKGSIVQIIRSVGDNEHIALFDSTEQASKAIKAVNSHQELVEALREMVLIFDRDLPDVSIGKTACIQAEQALKNTEEGE